MVKRLIVGLLGLVVVGAGIAVFAANTAQWVNVQARVEKEIEVACVDSAGVISPTGCDFGVVFPQNAEEKIVEVTLSNSFFNQRVKSDVFYWVLWECKQYSDGRDVDGNTIPDCRVDAPTVLTLHWPQSPPPATDRFRRTPRSPPSTGAPGGRGPPQSHTLF